MTQDIAQALAYQVKQEIAQQYFGFRKVIERDRQRLEDWIRRLNRDYEEKVGRDLARMYTLLQRPELIDRFLALAGFEDRPFYDPYVAGSPTIRRRLLRRIHRHGWTDRGRFWHLVEESYRRLFRDVYAYHDDWEAAREEAAVINEEIRKFTEKFALDEIVAFIQELDRRTEAVSVLGGETAAGSVEALQEKMALAPLPPLEERAPRLPYLPAPDRIRDDLKALAYEAFAAQEPGFRRLLREDEEA
ncbi:hypothetical protein G3N55_05070 [Dissulfurirhabdus thermomarina]|uniref:Uncharacterized protein n=1 Tax=Dissulfurirhabdus thermomarina TaxID=1765737 RepID=A0A6N9TUN1_DISTH|nr:hypothetical protein [Dissulfurirhabdus thermomarina]NDY42216.1 hypothetical protein [Dissulfurirhabdus thermomarina]NMX24119.1 hypothetical protein [Dissulfurirhabdus thermomarina]